MPVDVLIYAVVAAGLVLWLRSILGTRHGEERERPNPYSAEQGSRKANGSAETSGALAPGLPGQEDGVIRLGPNPSGKFVVSGKQAENGLVAVARAEKAFDPEHFLQGAQEAFIIIVEAFAKGDLETLRSLLGDAVYDSFEHAVTEREKRGETVTTEIHAIRKMEVTDAFVRDRMAYITIRFTADETCVIRGPDDEVISGNPERITEMIDVWVFARKLRSRDPRWLLTETRDDVVEDHKTPLPEAGSTPAL